MKIAKSCPNQDPLPPPGTLVPSPKKPSSLADWLINRWEDQNRRMVIRFGQFYQFDQTHWEPMMDLDVVRELYGILDRCAWVRVTAQGPQAPEPFDPDDMKLNKILHALKGKVKDYTQVKENSWIDDTETLVLPCRNGLVRMEDSVLMPHTPKYFCTFILQTDFDPHATCRRTDRFFRHLASGDKEGQRLLWEWYGYCLSGSNKYQKGLLLKGLSGCGKGVYMRLLNLILGRDNFIGFKVSDYERNSFPKEPLLGKSVVAFSDNRVDFGHKAFVDLVLEVIGNDPTTVRTPYARKSVNVYLPCRFMVLTNLLPTVSDDSGAFTRRFVAVECKDTPEKDIPDYEKALYQELPGILNRMLQGLQKLEQDKGFRQPEDSNWILETIKETSSLEMEFVRDRCVVGRGLWEYRDVVHSAYQIYALEQGEKALNKQRFGDALFAMGNIQQKKKGGVKKKNDEGQQVWVEPQRLIYDGVRLKESKTYLTALRKEDDDAQGSSEV